MKKYVKFLTVFLSMVMCLTLFSACGGGPQRKSYMYGVVNYKQVEGEEALFVFVPADYCGDIRVYVNKDNTKYPENLKDGDLIKLTFIGDTEIRQGAYNKFFASYPEQIEILGENTKIEEDGKNYRFTFPKNKVQNLSENNLIIDLYRGEQLVLSINEFEISGENITVKIGKESIFKVIENYGQSFIAS